MREFRTSGSVGAAGGNPRRDPTEHDAIDFAGVVGFASVTRSGAGPGRFSAAARTR